MTESDIIAIAKSLAAQHDLPWELVVAICKVESSLNPWAMRYEPAYKWLVGTDETLTATERIGQMISWGLMQVMGAVAREYGFTGSFPKLCEPTVGLQFGMLHLRKYRTRHGNWPDAIASYNAGRPLKRDEKYMNQGYVDKVTAHWQALTAHQGHQL